jgi:GSH-dependent disulfide-bond oxidoreductase
MRVNRSEIAAWLWATPNSRRVSILFEELGLAYQVTGVNIRRREQFAPDIVAMNPYGKIPIVAWNEEAGRRTLFESGAILIDFAEHYGQFLPASGTARSECLAWLMVVLTGLGPMTGQAHHWTALAPEKPAIAVQHSVNLVRRLYHVLDERLGSTTFLAQEYSIADIAAYPWMAAHDWASLDLAEFPNLAAWANRVGSRPAVMRGMRIPEGAKLEG